MEKEEDPPVVSLEVGEGIVSAVTLTRRDLVRCGVFPSRVSMTLHSPVAVVVVRRQEAVLSAHKIAPPRDRERLAPTITTLGSSTASSILRSQDSFASHALYDARMC